LKYVEHFEIQGKNNKGLNKMLNSLKERAEQNDKLKDYRDGFNTSHLEDLFEDKKSSSFNLSITSRILSKQLRKEVFKSCQIKKTCKILYLNSLKSASLRCINRKLAVRLQLSTDL